MQYRACAPPNKYHQHVQYRYRNGLDNERWDTQAFDGLVAISVRAVSEPLYRCLSQKIDTSIPN